MKPPSYSQINTVIHTDSHTDFPFQNWLFLLIVPKDDDDDLPDADYDDDDVFDVSNEPAVPDTAGKSASKSPAKRRTQSLSALKDKDEPRRAGKVNGEYRVTAKILKIGTAEIITLAVL